MDTDATSAMPPAAGGDLEQLLGRLDGGGLLARADLRDLPVSGPGSPVLRPQARQDPAALCEDGLADLVTSIGTVGQLQPIVVVDDGDGGPTTVLAGERRLRAMRVGHARQPELASWRGGTIRALVVPGPVGAWELRALQLAENLARRDLTDSDLARALVMARCGLLVERAAAAGLEPPDSLPDDPVARWDALVAWRDAAGARHQAGAPWPDVIATLGLALSPSRAKELVTASRRLPGGLAEALDAAEVSSRSRLLYGRLVAAGRTSDAEELLAAAAAAGGRAVHERALQALLADPGLQVGAAVDRAAALDAAVSLGARGATADVPADDGDGAGDGVPSPLAPQVDGSAAVAALRELAARIRAGGRLSDRDRGSLRMLTAEILP